MSYRYSGSGLDAVYLENGFARHDTAYGEGVSITDTDGLHRAIGDWLIFLSRPLDGAELRFLRLEMDLASRELADLLGVTERALRDWEKRHAKSLPGSTDRLLRVLYAEAFGLNLSLRRFAERLAATRASDPASAHFRWTQANWKIEPHRAAA